MSEKKEYIPKGFLLFGEYERYFKALPSEDQGRVLMAAFRYFNRGEIVDLGGMAQMLNLFIRDKIDHTKDAYQENCEKRAEGTKKYHDNLKSLEVTSSNSKYQTKTKTKTEAKTSVLVKENNTEKAEADASLVGGSASPPPMEELYGKSEGNSVFHSAIDKMLDERSKDD